MLPALGSANANRTPNARTERKVQFEFVSIAEPNAKFGLAFEETPDFAERERLKLNAQFSSGFRESTEPNAQFGSAFGWNRSKTEPNRTEPNFGDSTTRVNVGH